MAKSKKVPAEDTETKEPATSEEITPTSADTDSIGEAYDAIFSWISYWDNVQDALKTLAGQYPASEHIRNALISRAATSEMIDTLNYQVRQVANGDTGVRRPRTWAAMYPG